MVLNIYVYTYEYLGIRVIVIMDNPSNPEKKNNYQCLTQNSFDILPTDWSSPASSNDLLPITDEIGIALCPDLSGITTGPPSVPTTSSPTTATPTTAAPITAAPTTAGPTTANPTTAIKTDSPTSPPTASDEGSKELEITFTEPPNKVNNKTNITIIIDVIANKTGIDADKIILIATMENEDGGFTLTFTIIGDKEELDKVNEKEIEDEIEGNFMSHSLRISTNLF